MSHHKNKETYCKYLNPQGLYGFGALIVDSEAMGKINHFVLRSMDH